MTNEQRGTIVQMWAEGAREKDIADATGLPKTTVHGFVDKHRDLCPKRLRREPAVKRPGYGDIAALYCPDWEVA